MPGFTTKMHQIRIRLGSAADPARELTAPPDSLDEFRGRRGLGKDLGRGKGTGKGGDWEGREWGNELGGKEENGMVKGKGMREWGGQGKGADGKRKGGRFLTETLGPVSNAG